MVEETILPPPHNGDDSGTDHPEPAQKAEREKKDVLGRFREGYSGAAASGGRNSHWACCCG